LQERELQIQLEKLLTFVNTLRRIYSSLVSLPKDIYRFPGKKEGKKLTSNLIYSVWCNMLMCSSNTQLSFKGNEFSRLELHIMGLILTTH